MERFKILVFPMKRRTGKIRRTADILNTRQGKSADQYWRQVVDGLVGQLERAGFSENQIRLYVSDFQDAVQAQLRAVSRRSSQEDCA